MLPPYNRKAFDKTNSFYTVIFSVIFSNSLFQESDSKVTAGIVDAFQNIDFSECVRLPRDRDRKVTAPSADNMLRQEIEKLKIKPFLLKENLIRKIPRLVFFAGLEGTGHHLIDTTFKDVCSMVNVTKVSKCRAATNIIPNHVGNIGPKWDFRKLSEDPTKHEGFLNQIKDQKKYANEILFLNSMRHHSDKFLDAAVSYPDGGHPRIDNYPGTVSIHSMTFRKLMIWN